MIVFILLIKLNNENWDSAYKSKLRIHDWLSQTILRQKTTIEKERILLLTKKQCKQGHMPMKLEDLDAIQTIYTMVQEVCNDSERHNDDRCQWHSKYHWRTLSKMIDHAVLWCMDHALVCIVKSIHRNIPKNDSKFISSGDQIRKGDNKITRAIKIERQDHRPFHNRQTNKKSSKQHL